MEGLITKQEAAAVLGVTTRTIDTYIGRGLLERYKRGRRVLLNQQEVAELAQDKDEVRGPILNRRTVAALARRLARLERQVRLLLSVHEMDVPAVDLTEDTATSLHYGATLRDTGDNAIRGWIDVFLRLDEEALVVVERAVGAAGPPVFLRLCTFYLRHVRERADYSRSLELQKMHHSLVGAQKHLRQVLVAYVELARGDETRALLRAVVGPEVDPEGDILAQIAKLREDRA